MSNFKNYLLGLCLILVPACTTAQGSSGAASNSFSPDAKLYGEYLAASYAAHSGDAPARSDYFSRAFAHKPDDLALGRKAMVSALNTGDNVLSRALAIEVLTLDETDGLSRAILGANALRGGKYKQAAQYLGNANDGVGLEDINALIRGWAEHGLGQNDLAELSFSNLGGGKYFEIVGTLQNAKLYAEMGDTDKAATAFALVDEVGISSVESVMSQARARLSRGEKDEALAGLKVFARDNTGIQLAPVTRAIEALETGDDIETKLTPAQSASRAITEPAFGYYAALKQYDAAEIFLRLAIELDPENDKAYLFLGSVLEEAERNDEARVLYGKIATSSPYTVSARLSEANILFGEENNAEALGVLTNIHKTHPSSITLRSMGRAHLILEDYAAALPYYEALINDMTAEELEKNPQPLYLRGICLERLDRWQEAVTDFEFVLKHQPENADALNYLGYTWVDKGVNLTKAFDMINKAVELQPESGAIIDSLGWAHYKLGHYSEARIKLEDAAQRAPTSATIIDHLGDVYWKVGRRREAGYQWERALTLDPTDKEVRVIKAKLQGGLAAGSTVN